MQGKAKNKRHPHGRHARQQKTHPSHTNRHWAIQNTDCHLKAISLHGDAQIPYAGWPLRAGVDAVVDGGAGRSFNLIRERSLDSPHAREPCLA